MTDLSLPYALRLRLEVSGARLRLGASRWAATAAATIVAGT